MAATMYTAWDSAAIASYDDVGRSPAPQPVDISLRKKISLCSRVNYVKVPASVISSFAGPKKIPQGFCFQVKVLVPKRPRSKN